MGKIQLKYQIEIILRLNFFRSASIGFQLEIEDKPRAKKSDQMEDVRRFAKEKLDITEQDVIDYINRHRPRVISHAIAFSLQFIFVFFFTSGNNWKDRYMITKLWVLLWIIVLMTLFELIRYSDFILKKYGLLHYLGGADGGSGGSSGGGGSKSSAPKSSGGGAPKPKSATI